MNQSFEKVLSYLSGTGNTDDVPVGDLQKLINENPYFPVGHFLLSKKLKNENAAEFSQQVQKTALYFSNPHWLHYQLSDDLHEAVRHVQNDYTEFEGKPADELKTNDIVIDDSHPITTVFSTDELTAAGNLAHQTLQEIPEADTTIENNSEQTKAEVTPSQEIKQAEEVSATLPKDAIEEHENLIGHLTADPDEALPHSSEKEVYEWKEEMAGATRTSENKTENFLQEAENNTDTKYETGQDDEHDRMFQNIKAMLDASSEEADADTKNAAIHIDPYYTIDYFASQGIKLELDQNPQDQLGQNLKKFTHWLRHMKKLGPEDATEVISRTETDADIQKIADTSNTVREVVTEAMASVLVKQGKKDKAIELYNKLSFLNPGKSAYFADQIKKLKGT